MAKEGSLASRTHEKFSVIFRGVTAREFEIEDSRKLRYFLKAEIFLGIKVAKLEHGVFISQQKYIQDF